MKTLNVDDEVHELVMKDCVAELLRSRPELMKTKISQNKMVYHLAKYYLEN